MNLAMVRKAAQMTQVEVARKLGVGQGVVSRLTQNGLIWRVLDPGDDH
jgi:transcriptional regulator with XRE-family HTH domain